MGYTKIVLVFILLILPVGVVSAEGSLVINTYSPVIINSTQILPFSDTKLPPQGSSISINQTPGSYEASSFVIKNPGSTSLSGINFSQSSLSDGLGNTIPASAIDISLVKAWYQSGGITDTSNIKSTDPMGFYLSPELLLKDDALINVSYTNQNQKLRVLFSNGTTKYIAIDNTTIDAFPSDISIFNNGTGVYNNPQPLTLLSNENRQVWITSNVSSSQATGTYTGTITVSSPATADKVVNISIRVLPFILPSSSKPQAIYYWGKLARPADAPAYYTPQSDWKTETQYSIELNDMKNHGVLYPQLTGYYDTVQTPGSTCLYCAMERMVALRSQSGLPKDRIYLEQSNIIANDFPADERLSSDNAVLLVLKNRLLSMQNLTTTYGFGDLYAMGYDEPTAAQAPSMVGSLRTVINNGSKTFYASLEQGADQAGSYTTQVNLAAIHIQPTIASIWRTDYPATKIYSYNDPQMGEENPEIYRNHYGLWLWNNTNIDGAMNFAYMRGFGQTIWNDYDNTPGSYRDYAMAYPVTNGVIDTIQWEGYREGVDDSQYADKLTSITGTRTAATTIIKSGLAAGVDSSVIRGNLIDAILAFGYVTPTAHFYMNISTPTPTPTTPPTTVPTTIVTTSPTTTATTSPPDQYGVASYTGATPIGGGTGYTGGIYTSGDYTVTTLAQFNSHMVGGSSPATSGQVVFIPSGTNITFPAGNTPAIPVGVTVASDRGYSGHTGAVLKKTASSGSWSDRMLDIGGNNVRVTGLILEGEMFPSTSSPVESESLYLEGIKNYGGYTGEIVDNNEIRGWAYSGVEVRGIPTAGRPWIHNNYIHHNQARGEGYGTEVYGGDALIEANIYDYNRHDVTGTGASGEKYEFRYNIIQGGCDNPIGGTHVDVHESIDNTNEAGNTFLIHHNTVLQGSGTDQEAFVHIRDIPYVGAYVYNNDIQAYWPSSNYDGAQTIMYQSHSQTITVSAWHFPEFITNNKWNNIVYSGTAATGGQRSLYWLQCGSGSLC